MSQAYEIRLVDVARRDLAVVKDVAWAQNIGPKIGGAMPLLYGQLQQLGVTNVGQNVVVYNVSGEERWDQPPGVPIEVGVQLQAPLAIESAPVVRSETPAARVATTLHVGPYQALPAAHTAVHAWCREHGAALTGKNWEVYGHHTDDPSQLRTEVFYELK